MIDAKDLSISVDVLPEEIPIRGNLIASGNDEIDRKEEDRVTALLEHIAWAWCIVRVSAEFHGLKAEDYLGGCSYDSEDEFRACGYYDDMVETCRKEIEAQAAYIGGWIRGRIERHEAESC